MNIKNCAIILILFLQSSCTSKYSELYNKKPAFYSYIEGDALSGRITKEYNDKAYVTPASCQKIVTALLGIKGLGLDYKYNTELLVDKRGKKIHNIIIKFSGDPTLTSEQLGYLLSPLKNTKITGNVILDASIFQTPPHSPNLMIDDIGKSYSAPVSSINIDKNIITVKLYPKEIGEIADVKSDNLYDIKSSVITNDEKTSVKLEFINEEIHAIGNINSKDSIIEIQISPKNHYEYVSNKLKSILSSLSIKGKIKIVENQDYKNDGNIQTIDNVESDSLSEIIKPALKISDNLVFDSIYLSLINAYSSDKKIENWNQGNEIIKNLAKKHLEIDTNNALFVDGSGLSRYNRIQPQTLFTFLKKGFDINEFIDSFPSPNEENSTLKNRTLLSSDIRAKTGNMSGISCLCGYKFNKKNAKVFVFVSNSFAPPNKDMHDITDSFISKSVK